MSLVISPFINGHRYSYGSIEASFDGLIIAGIVSINYADELIPGIVFGSEPNRVGRTAGKRNPTCEFEMLRREFAILRNRLGQSFGRKSFEIVVTYAESGDEATTTDTIVQCRITKVDVANREGSDPLAVKITCDPNGIRWGREGLSLDEPDDRFDLEEDPADFDVPQRGGI